MNKELLKLAYDLLTKCQSDEGFEKKARLGMGCERIAYKLNDDYIVKIAKNVDKVALRKAIQAGLELEGVELVATQSLVIK